MKKYLNIFIHNLTLLILFTGITGCGSLAKSVKDQGFQKKFSKYDYCNIDAVKQSSQITCGAACLSSLLKYWGKDLSEADLLRKYPPDDKKGYPLYQLKSICDAEGLKAFVLSMSDYQHPEKKSSLGQLTSQIKKGRPVLLAVKFSTHDYVGKRFPLLGFPTYLLLGKYDLQKDHYVIAFGLNDKNILLMDPGYGYTAIKKKKLKKRWQPLSYTALLIVDN